LHQKGYKDVMHHVSLNEKFIVAIFTIASWNPIVLGFGEVNQNFGFTIERGIFLEYFKIFIFVKVLKKNLIFWRKYEYIFLNVELKF
jgi:hypothetical protein